MANEYVLTKKELKRYNELYEKATNYYLDKTDFDATEWLSDDEANELQQLIDKEQGND